MRVKIEKLRNGSIEVEFQADAESDTRKVVIAPQHIDNIILMLQAAKTAKVLGMQLKID